jgi:hypothetical protein
MMITLMGSAEHAGHRDLKQWESQQHPRRRRPMRGDRSGHPRPVARRWIAITTPVDLFVERLSPALQLRAAQPSYQTLTRYDWAASCRDVGGLPLAVPCTCRSR